MVRTHASRDIIEYGSITMSLELRRIQGPWIISSSGVGGSKTVGSEEDDIEAIEQASKYKEAHPDEWVSLSQHTYIIVDDA